MESCLRVRHQESVPPTQRIAYAWQCTYHRRTGNSLCWDEQPCHLYVEQQRGKDAALWTVFIMSAPSAAFADEFN